MTKLEKSDNKKEVPQHRNNIIFQIFQFRHTSQGCYKEEEDKKILFLMILTDVINSILWVFQLTAKVFNILLQAIKYIRYNS